MQWRKGNLFNNWCLENWTATCKRMKLENYLTPHTKVTSKRIKDVNVRLETIKLPEENIDSTTFEISLSDFFFLDLSPQARKIKVKINKWDLGKIKSFCKVMEIIEKTKKPTEWEKIFGNGMSDKRLISKI